MPKRSMKTHSRQAAQAIQLLGHLIKVRRLELKITAEDLAARAGISRALLYRIERGDPACSIGAVFEVAAIVGVPLFGDDTGGTLASHLQRYERELMLLPRAVRNSHKPVYDDF
ncbi:helix-turn-helix transcriptional regulator [Microvirga tunisiensis]|uniref:Helix-turn-helix transcriptional regulator n=1 Tax=Microvirga tunisiensis TaxID=2108360 RepID=A0A5N7MSZ7_9HYPH|nr:helix-turn-helix transcriptional regulator [Microvirga tunisiensis]MPR08934.1 helix-turn-helix transcriptional regulator [Microvirga tunisiensis]MPR27136.1 helix-turn-helix transcriptional regulator [Microvirga tunisiensis]